MAYETAAQIISDAAIELSIVAADISDPFASTDANVIQLGRLLTSVGRELVEERHWTHLQKSHTFSTSNGTYVYSLPSDFDRMMDQTQWNRTTQLPAGGPVEAQAWQYLQAQTSAATITVLFRTVNGELWLYPTPTSTQTIAFEYVTAFWVKPTGQTAPTTSRVSAATDTLYFDPLLLVRGLKLAWKRAKGMDTTAAQGDYDARLEQAKNADGAAPVLSISPGAEGIPLIDGRNLPITGFGS